MSESNLGIEQPKSPVSGGNLVNKGDGLYFGESDGRQYMRRGEKIVPLIDPMSGSDLIPDGDGNYTSKHTGEKFQLYNEGFFVPLFIPDDTLEPAHVERGRLVGDKTGRSFEIREHGEIMTPIEIENERIAKETSEVYDAFEQKISRLILKNMSDYGEFNKSLIGEGMDRDERERLEAKYKKQMEDITAMYSKGLDIIIHNFGSKDLALKLEEVFGKKPNKSEETEVKSVSETKPDEV